VLMYLGVPREKAGAVIAMSALFGMVAPPVNIPALIIGAGVDLPYVGFDLPLLAFTIPLALLSTWTIALRHCRRIGRNEQILDSLPPNHLPECGLLMFLPLVVVLGLILGERLRPAIFNLGLPLIFMIGALLTIFTGRKTNLLLVSRDAMNKAMPILGILAGVGMFIQVMTLTGARGEVVIQTLQLPRGWFGLYPMIGLAMPLFGAVSSYGAASVLGAPFLLALPTGSAVIVLNAAMLSMIVALGDLMPPTALAGIFAAQVVGEPKYSRVLRWCVVPGIVTALVSLLAIQFSAYLAPILVHF
jgi:TRAP-type C4-dicarboxylate transport system permease large subunit